MAASTFGLSVGEVVRYEGRVWRVGMVNFTRARLDPLTGKSVVPDPTSGRCFTSYGSGVSVSPNSTLERVDPHSIDDEAIRRMHRLEETTQNVHREQEQEEEIDMDEQNDDAAVSAAPIPESRAKVNAKKLAKKPDNKATRLGTKPPVKGGKVAAKQEKAPRVMKPCACGCGGQTAGYFIPGHDAKFKSWLLNLERGKHQIHGQDLKDGQERTPLPKKVQEQYKWVKRGGGWVPTTNYKGEPHKGYDKE